ncbi:MAG: prenyltransferase [Candidatus Sericytochromatia bacterium]|nr:prenyltransferase [Candidatus Sericytochromatia bacterium]
MAWWQAARFPSQVYLWGPLLLGQALAWRETGRWEAGICALVLGYGLAQQLFIVFANDLADAETDRLNPHPTFLSGGSRVLVEGRLSAGALARAAVVAAIAALLLAIALGGWTGTPLLPLLALGGLALLWAYSYPPLRLSFRGGGEGLQALGLGGVLPLFGYLAQAGSLAGFPVWIWASLLPLQLALALATSLPDEPGDRLVAKRTCAVVWGGARVRTAIVALLLFALAAWPFLHPLTGAWQAPAWRHSLVPAACLILMPWLSARAATSRAWLLAFVVSTALVVLSWMLALWGDAAGWALPGLRMPEVYLAWWEAPR